MLIKVHSQYKELHLSLFSGNSNRQFVLTSSKSYERKHVQLQTRFTRNALFSDSSLREKCDEFIAGVRKPIACLNLFNPYTVLYYYSTRTSCLLQSLAGHTLL